MGVGQTTGGLESGGLDSSSDAARKAPPPLKVK